jgi:KRAB domain-containing zinc finger protein
MPMPSIIVNTALACSSTRQPCILINKFTCNLLSLCYAMHPLICFIHFYRKGKQFSCDLCGKEFQKKIQLDMHHRSIHSDVRPFSCRFCDKTFKSKLTQRQHERIHTGERPYQCPQCPKAFRQDVHLANHIRLHTGEKPFVCTYCNKAFAHKNNLSIHVKIHTGVKNTCGVCGLVFRTIVKLRLHESTHTPTSIPSVEEQMADETP